MTRKHVGELYDSYPDITGLFVWSRFEDSDINAITRFRRLNVLSVGSLDISAAGVKDLASLRSLEVLRAGCSRDLKATLESALPACELHLSVIDDEGF